jgi:tetratricopeptide (TPR) repeat protein
MGNYSLIFGEYARAEESITKFLEQSRRLYGEEWGGTLHGMKVLGHIYHKQRKYAEALATFSKLVETCDRVWGPADPMTLIYKNSLAWRLATTPDEKGRAPARAVELAEQLVRAQPENGGWLNTLGVAYYRAGDWKAAVATLEKAMARRDGGNPADWLFLAMAHWQLGHKDEARRWYDKGAASMDQNKSQNEEHRRFRAEAAQLLGVPDPPPMPEPDADKAKDKK